MCGLKLVLGLVLVCLAQISRAEVDILNPVRSASDDEVTSLPGLNWKPNFKQYSGYLDGNSTSMTKRFFHYWFVESQSNPSQDPVVLWMGSGDEFGGSMLGLFKSTGPFRVEPDGNLSENPYSWNKYANMIYLNSPIGTGYSYSFNETVYFYNQPFAEVNHHVLKQFFIKFPQFKSNRVYLTGEHLGSLWLSFLGSELEKDPEIDFRGVAVGNAYVDEWDPLSLQLFYYRDLISDHQMEGLSKACCKGKPISRSQIDCDFGDLECRMLLLDVYANHRRMNLNVYNINKDCALYIKGPRQTRAPKTGGKFQVSTDELNLVKCLDYNAVDVYLNRPDVCEALHVPERLDVEFPGYAHEVFYFIDDASVASAFKKLLGRPNIKILFYSGDSGIVNDYVEIDGMIRSMNLTEILHHVPWFTGEQLAGFLIQYEGVTHMTLKGAGSFPARDAPDAALEMFRRFLLD